MTIETLGGGNLPAFFAGIMFLLPLIIAWSLVWKGWSLWIAARAGSKVWFVVLLIVNTMGILEILYIFWLSKSKCSCGTCASCMKAKNQPK